MYFIAMSVCNANPCHNEGHCYMQGSLPACSCPEGTTGLLCEQLLLTVPNDTVHYLSVTVQSSIYTLQLPKALHTPVTVAITVDSSIAVSPSTVITIPSNALTATFTLTATATGIYTLQYAVLSEERFAPVNDQYLIVHDSVPSSDYFERNSLSLGIMEPQCCSNVNISFCPSQTLTLSSACSTVSNQWINSEGITFIQSSNNFSIPVSIIGTQFNTNSLSLTPSTTGHCTDCDNCTDANDIQGIVQHNSLIRTFFNSIRNILPPQLILSQIGDTQGNSYHMYNHISSIVSRKLVHTLNGCESIPSSTKDTPTYIIRSDTFLNVTINDRIITYKDLTRPPVCYMIELCQLPQSYIGISLPKPLGELIGSLIVTESFLPSNWPPEISSVQLSSYGIDSASGRNVHYWDGNEWTMISYTPHTIGLAVSVSSDITVNGLLSMNIDFNGRINISPVSRYVSININIAFDLLSIIYRHQLECMVQLH